jgi:hypothetical protein
MRFSSRKWPSDMKTSCEYIERAAADGRRGGPSAWGLGVGLTIRHKISPCYEMLHKGEVKLKVKFSLCFFNQAPRHESIWGTGGIAPRIL